MAATGSSPFLLGFSLHLRIFALRLGSSPRLRVAFWPRLGRTSLPRFIPAVRGCSVAAEAGADGSGFIPTPAGFPAAPAPRLSAWAVHPRSRGVCCAGSHIKYGAMGSSPPPRGLPPVSRSRPHGPRFIPAPAGSAPLWLALNSGFMVHPRSRGVCTAVHVADREVSGSSPLPRGLPFWRDILYIPAGGLPPV